MPVAKGQLNKRLLVAIVLDRSSSMSCVRAETISSTNEQFSALRDSDDAANTLVAFFSFNQQVTPVFKNDDGTPALMPCSDLKDINEGDYYPSGTTSMYDAVGDAIAFFLEEAKKNDDVLIVVISDGEENTSTRFTSEQISSRVKELQEAGWNFTYIGANQDLAVVQEQLGIHQGNMLRYSSDAAGTVQMGNTVSSAVRSYTASRTSFAAKGGEGRLSTQNLYDPSSQISDNVADDGHEVGDTVDLTVSGPTITSTAIPVVDEDKAGGSKGGDVA